MKIQFKISKQHNNKVNKLKILINKMKRPSEIISKVDAALRFVTENVVFAIGNCSDIAEAVGITNLDGEEGSIIRLKDCTEKVATRLAEREEEIVEIKGGDRINKALKMFIGDIDWSRKDQHEGEQGNTNGLPKRSYIRRRCYEFLAW